MKDDLHHRQTPGARIQDAEIRRLAQRAIGMLAAAGHFGADGVRDRLSLLCDAFIASDGERHHEAIARIREDGISGRDIIDYLIPPTARLMGERWFADQISFADVTIGSARLQEAVRALAASDRDESRRSALAPDAPEILLILPQGEDHSLGLFVTADQFRRLGYRVEVAIDQHPRQIVNLVRNRAFAMVGITVSGRRTLASAKDLVEKIRATVTRVTPIVVGGTSLDAGADVLSVTGADHIARDARTALQLCGLSLALAEAHGHRLGEPKGEGEDATAVKGEVR